MDGLDIGQTTAICNAIGKKARMEGNTFREFAVSQMLLAHAEELYAGMQRFNPTVNVSLEKKKVTQEDYLAWWSKAIPGHFEKLEALLGQYMGRFTSSGTTVGELYLFSILHQVIPPSAKSGKTGGKWARYGLKRVKEGS